MSEFSTEIAKPFEFNNPGPLDKNRGPYATVADACKAIPNITKNIGGVNRNLREGKVVDIGIPPNTVEHKWKDSFSDTDLQPVMITASAWLEKPYFKGNQVLHAGNIYEAVLNTTAQQEPGIVNDTIWKQVTGLVEPYKARKYKIGDKALNSAKEQVIAVRPVTELESLSTPGAFMKQGITQMNEFNFITYIK